MARAREGSGFAAGWDGKNPGRLLRLALVFELLAWAVRGDAEPATVSADAVARAGAYLDYAGDMLHRVTAGLARTESEADAAHALNAAGAGHVAQACERRRIPLIHTSTDYVFDGAKPSPYREDDHTAPLNVYGGSKLAGERLVMNLCSRHIIVRTAWLVSSHGRNFVTTMLRLAETRPNLDVVDDQHGSPTFAPHLATAILAISERLAGRTAPWGIYHAAGAGEATWCDVAREVFSVSASLNGPSASVRPISSTDYPTSARRPANSRLNCQKLEQAFGVRFADWRVGIAECVRSLHAPDRAGRVDSGGMG